MTDTPAPTAPDDLRPGRHRAESRVGRRPTPGPGRPPRSFRRYQLPPDGQWHTFRLSGKVVAAGTRYEGLIEFWALDSGDEFAVERQLGVFWDEQTLPEGAQHLHTVIAGRLVWHLCELR